jgi:hypothetical protein
MIRPTVTESPRERDCLPEPEPLRSDREIWINGYKIQEFEFKGNFYVYVNGLPCRETYEGAINICAKHKGA